MKTAHDALRFLAEEGLCHPNDLVWGHDAPLTSAAPDAEARAGDVAWMSSKGLARAPERLASFGGTLLVLPREAEDDAVPEGVNAARCSKPKLAFSKVVTVLFDRRSQPGWPVATPAYPEGTTFGEGVVLAPGVVLGEGVRLGDRVRIGPNTCLAHCIVGNDVEIGANCSIGLAGYGYDRDDDGVLFRFPHLGNVIIEDEVSIGSNTCIDRGALGSTIIGRGCKIDNLVHVAHNVVVKPGALLIAHAMIGGSTTIGERAWIAPTAALLNQIEVGHDAVVGMGAVVVKTVAPGAVVVGNPARPLPPRTP